MDQKLDLSHHNALRVSLTIVMDIRADLLRKEMKSLNDAGVPVNFDELVIKRRTASKRQLGSGRDIGGGID